MKILDWFRTKFILQATDETVAQLIFLYKKHCNPDNISGSEKEFIAELVKEYKTTEAEE